MIEQVKMLMDEQSREALQRLRSDFEEILRPLNSLNDLRQNLDSLSESQEESATAVQRKVCDIADALGESKQSLDGVNEGCRLIAHQLTEIGTDVSMVKYDLSGVKEACLAMKQTVEGISDNQSKGIKRIEVICNALLVQQTKCLKVVRFIRMLVLILVGIAVYKLFW